MDLFSKIEEMYELIRKIQVNRDRPGGSMYDGATISALWNLKQRNFEKVYFWMNVIYEMPGISWHNGYDIKTVMRLAGHVIDATKQPRTLRNGRGGVLKHKALTVGYHDRFPYSPFFDALEQYVATGELSDVFVGEYPYCFDPDQCENYGARDGDGNVVMSFDLPPKSVVDRILKMEPKDIIYHLEYKKVF